MRRVLMVAYHFPPVAGVGVERSLKHATYLPDTGWQPVVVAPRNSAYRLIDETTLARIPTRTEVHRATTLEPGHVRHALRWLLRGPRSTAASGAGTAPRARRRGGVHGALEAAWGRYVHLAFFPDEQLLWAPDAIRTGWQAHASRPVDAIYSSSPPVTSHLVAAALKQLTGRPWIADFRDPWIGNAYARPLTALQRAMQASMERSIVASADCCVFASGGVREEYARRYPGLAGRFTVIHNGYDIDDIAAATAAEQSVTDDDRFRLIFTGSVQGAAEFELFAGGMERLLEARPDLRTHLVVQLVGWFSPVVEALARHRLPRLEPVVQRLGFQPKAATLALLRAADAALVLLADAPGREHVPSAKLFDYLGLDRPVLAVAPPGEVRRILADLDWGIGADPTPAGFVDGVVALLDSPPLARPADPDRRYERRSLTRRLARILDELAARRPRKR